MKIRTVKTSGSCIGICDGEKLHVGCLCMDDLDYVDPDIRATVSSNEHENCLMDQVAEEELFFLSLFWSDKRAVTNSYYGVGMFKKDGDHTYLNPVYQISGHSFEPLKNRKVLVLAYQPTSTAYIPSVGSSVMTSDGLIFLEDGDFVAKKLGEINAVNTNDVLEMLSKGSSERSPRYSRLELLPLKSRPSRPLRGTVILNDTSKKIEYYDGTNWIAIKTEE